jgi:acetate---CoA ligase (ADP-forming) subunit beta
MKTPAEIIQTALKEGRKALFEHEAKALARSVGIIAPKSALVNPEREKEIIAAGETLGFPLALKAESTEVLHKTEAGAVVLDIKNKGELASAVKQIKNSVSQRAPGAIIRHFLIEKMMPTGLELLIGGLRDDQFGPCVAFGLGGVWVEALKDAVFGILPMTHEEASEMIAQTRAGTLLKGFRNGPALDEEALHLIINNLSVLMTNHPQIGSIDLNPVRCYVRGAAALDVRVVLE